MKKTTSFHLEEDILEEIESYQKKYNLSSRNVALERMLLERRTIMTFPIMNISNKLNNDCNIVINEDKKEDDFISKSMKNTRSSMPD